MNLLKILGKAKGILGKLTDLLLKGRQAGLWNEKNGIPSSKKITK